MWFKAFRNARDYLGEIVAVLAAGKQVERAK